MPLYTAVIFSKISKHLKTFSLVLSSGSAIRIHICANNGAEEFKHVGS